MRFGYTILYVDDVSAALDFYERAFGLKRAFLHESGDYGQLDTGATALAFSSRRLMTELGKTPGIPDAARPTSEVAFVTDDVPAALARALSAGAKLVQPAETMPWGQTVAYVTDREGFFVELCTPIAPTP
jgi:uncharacterized glyoxalase superfamily protein PhnB